MKIDLAGWPAVDRSQVCSQLREIPMSAYLTLSGYTRDDVHAHLSGQGGLFLAQDMARQLSLERGMRVLDLACGAGATSLFLARTYGVTVFAVDLAIPDGLFDRVRAAGLVDRVVPLRADARDLPFVREYFDAVFTMNALFYFGTESTYPSYLASFLKPSGELVVGSPCYREELTDDTPSEFMIEYPACLQVHSPGWWRRHFEGSGRYTHVTSELHASGVEFWHDRVRYLLDREEPGSMPDWKQRMVRGMISLLNRDESGFVSHLVLHAKRGPD